MWLILMRKIAMLVSRFYSTRHSSRLQEPGKHFGVKDVRENYHELLKLSELSSYKKAQGDDGTYKLSPKLLNKIFSKLSQSNNYSFS